VITPNASDAPSAPPAPIASEVEARAELSIVPTSRATAAAAPTEQYLPPAPGSACDSSLRGWAQGLGQWLPLAEQPHADCSTPPCPRVFARRYERTGITDMPHTLWEAQQAASHAGLLVRAWQPMANGTLQIDLACAP
jgi:hypothetical protein